MREAINKIFTDKQKKMQQRVIMESRARTQQSGEPSKNELRAMFAQAAQNTADLRKGKRA